MPNQKDYSILGLLDGTISAEMEFSEFEVRLVHSILLEPGLLLTDAYLFSSPVLFKHIEESRKGGKSLFEMAVERQLVIPAPRMEVGSYEEMYDRLVEAQIAADWAGGLELAFRLDSLTSDFRPTVWPPEMGVSYAKMISDVLHRQPDEVDEDLWHATEELRYDVVDSATAMSEQTSGVQGDLRRGDLVRAVGLHFNINLADPAAMINRNEILRVFKIRNPELTLKARAIDAFFDWTDEAHRANYARRLAVRSNLFWDPMRDRSVLDPIGSGPAIPRNVTRQADLAAIEAEVKLPRAKTLLQYAPEQILQARDLGMAWQAKARMFMHEPSIATRVAAEAALDQFAKELRRFDPGGPTQALTVKAVSDKLPKFSGSIAKAFDPRYGPHIVTLATGGSILYKYSRRFSGRQYKMNPRPSGIGQAPT